MGSLAGPILPTPPRRSAIRRLLFGMLFTSAACSDDGVIPELRQREVETAVTASVHEPPIADDDAYTTDEERDPRRSGAGWS